MLLHSVMAATCSSMACAKLSILGYAGRRKQLRNRRGFSISAQQQPGQPDEVQEPQELNIKEPEVERKKGEPKGTVPRPVEPQLNVKSKNMGKEYGGDWLSSATRHVRIYAAYIDPETSAFDQTQMDKLIIILDPTDEFVWTPETTNKVYSYFQELVDHYEGADLTEYTLRLIGSDIEHYIRKLLYDGEIKYNMDARVLNFSRASFVLCSITTIFNLRMYDGDSELSNTKDGERPCIRVRIQIDQLFLHSAKYSSIF